jgi:hypothetical protein
MLPFGFPDLNLISNSSHTVTGLKKHKQNILLLNLEHKLGDTGAWRCSTYCLAIK